ncbi:MAG: threonine--tRNA ligase [Candidatus Thorarchaeota archaeon]
MRLLQIHSQGFSYAVKRKAIKNAEEIEEKSYSTDDTVLVNFIAAEASDAADIARASEIAADIIATSAQEVKETRVIVYPWVHLSDKPAPPSSAFKILKNIEKILRDKGLSVVRAPFGWYKAFTVNCIGHPLAERSKIISIAAEPSATAAAAPKEDLTAIQAEEKATSRFYIMEPDGKMTEADKFDYTGYEELRLYVKYETAKDRTSKEPPPHIEMMKNLELVDYEPGSDAGNFRWPPRGLTLKKVVEGRITEEMLAYGAHVVQTPLIYDYQHPSLKSYLQRFPSRQYIVRSGDTDYFARFSACFGQFLLLSEAQVSYRQLPLKLFEIAPSYRREQSGELAGMRRPRAFTMPDIHEFVADLKMAKQSVLNQMEFVQKLMGELEVRYEVSFRVLRSFLEEDPEFVRRVVARVGKPVMIEVFDQRYAYFVFKGEWNVVDAQQKAACLGTIQIDVENAERFHITYVDEDGKEKHPLILHTSPSGSLERILYGVLEQANKDKMAGKKPKIPLWMSPVHVRMLPVDSSKVEYCMQIGRLLEGAGIRYEIDDRDMTVAKKVRAAEKLWTPYICVIGEKETSTGVLTVRKRESDEQIELTPEALVREIREKISFAPPQRLLLPVLVSKQAIFSREV